MTSSRTSAAAFTALCLAGSVAAVGLTVREAMRTPAVVTSVAGTARTGLTTAVTVTLRDTTDQARCVRLRVAARDSAGHDLRAVQAPDAVRLPPRGTARVTLRLTLTARDYAERLHAFYPSTKPCAAG